MSDLDKQLRQLLVDLSRSLHEALAESSEVGKKLEKIRQEGYSVYLLLDANRHDRSDGSGGADRSQRSDRAQRPDRKGEGRIELSETPSSAARTPTFRINSRDLLFLRSIGIDPTRQLRRRSSRQPQSDSSS